MALAAAHIQNASLARTTGCVATARKPQEPAFSHDQFGEAWVVAKLHPGITERTARGFVLPSKASYCSKASPCHRGAYSARLRPAINDPPHTPQVNGALANHNHSMTPLIRIIRHVMIMTLMLAIAMMMAVMQRCTSIVRAFGSQLATPSTKLKCQQRVLAKHWPAAPQGIALPRIKSTQPGVGS